MSSNKHVSRGTTQKFGVGTVLLAGVVIATLTVLLFLASARTTPWKSFVPDLDRDGSPDIATHASLDQCVEHIRSLKVSGTCGLQCNLLNHCVTNVQVDSGPLGAAWRTAPAY